LTIEKDYFPKCPKCGSREIKTTSAVVGGLLVPKVREDGTLGYPPGAKTITRVFCEGCGIERKNHPSLKKNIDLLLEDILKPIE
jgi:hypothetical protein